jgi:MFS family permease
MNQKKGSPKIAIAAMSLMAMAALGISPGLASISAAFPEISANSIALLITLPTITVMIMSLFVAKLNQYLSKKNIVMLGMLIVVISGILPYFISGFSFMLITRAILGVGVGLINPLSASLPMDHYPVGKDRDQALGMQSAFSGGSAILFTMVGGYLANAGWRNSFLVYLCPIVLMLVVWFTLPDLGTVQTEKTGKIVIEKTGIIYTLFIFIYMTMFNTLSLNVSYLVANANGTSMQSGYVSSAFSLLAFLGGIVFAYVAKIFQRFTLSFGLLLSGLGLVIMGATGIIPVMMLGAAVSGMGMCTVMPSCIGKISAKSSPAAATFAISLFMAGSSIGQFATPYVVSALASIGGGAIPAYYVMPGIGIIVMTVLNALVNFRQEKPVNTEVKTA